MRQQDFRLGCEQQRAVEHAPVKRLFTEAIARDEQAPPLIVPEREGEHSIEMLDHFAAVFFVEMRQDLGIRSAAKSMTARFEIGAQLAVVVNFTVEDDRDAVVLVEGRLLTVE